MKSEDDSLRQERPADRIRPVHLQPGTVGFAEGSCLASMGRTQVLCAASVEDDVPPWRRESGLGWVTAEYAMLPRATGTRTPRERSGMRGRTQEIQRLIGRSLRAAVDLGALGPRTVVVDCDVLQADGGTRTAAVTGGFVALARALEDLLAEGALEREPVVTSVAAVSVGLVEGRPLLDLDYQEDRDADVDLNVVGTGDGRLVEVQGTAEGDPFSREKLDEMLDLAQIGIRDLTRRQSEAIGEGRSEERDAERGPRGTAGGGH